MGQFFIGVEQVQAVKEERGDVAGYCVYHIDRGHTEWMTAAAFEARYIPMGLKGFRVSAAENDSGPIYNENTVTQQMVDGFIKTASVRTEGKTTIVLAELANGFEIVEASSCVDPSNYDEAVGRDICSDRIKNKVWHLLGFVLQWARRGCKS